jgi:hypothetical protein
LAIWALKVGWLTEPILNLGKIDCSDLGASLNGRGCDLPEETPMSQLVQAMRAGLPDNVERWSIYRLVPYARNARTHSDEQVAQIAASIREFGFTNPVLVDENGTLIAGHGRVLGAYQLGITDVPTMVARGWTLSFNTEWAPERFPARLVAAKIAEAERLLALLGGGNL